MLSAEQLRELAPATTPAELLQLLRKFHDKFLLLDPGFIEDANLLRLFGPGEVRLGAPIKRDIATRKMFVPVSDSALGNAVEIRISSARIPEFIAGGVSFSLGTEFSSYTADLIEQYLMPDVQGEDPLRNPNNLAPNENMDAAARRPRATHPKGYFFYKQIKKVGACRSILSVRLHGNGTLWDIELNQQETK